MTLLNYIVKSDQIELYSDTLVLNESNDKIRFNSKIFLLPHFNCVVCGAGSFNLIFKWYTFIQNCIIGRDIRTLDNFAPDQLEKIYSELNEPTVTSIYHFGFSYNDNKHIGFRYQSSENFESELLEDCFSFKPYSEEIMQYIKETGTNPLDIDGMLKLIDIQKQLDEKKYINEKIGVGGKIYYYVLKRHIQCVSEVYTFEDFGEDCKIILSKAKLPDNIRKLER